MNKMKIISSLMIISFIFAGFSMFKQARHNASFVKTPQIIDETVTIGGKFKLLNQDNIEVSSDDFKGKYKVIFFGFTNCPMICPVGMEKITESLMAMDKNLVSKITPLFISVDPDRDTPEVIKEFVEGYSEVGFIGLTGDKATIEEVVKNYKIYKSKVKTEDNDPKDEMDYDMDHSAYIYIMGKDNEFINVVSSNETVTEIKKRISDAILSN